MAQSPQAKYRKDYQSPSHSITDIDLTFDLFDTETVVTAVSQVKQLKDSTSIYLDGEELELKALSINGEAWSDYQLVEGGLEIHGLPQQFELTVVTQINPEANTALEGLYKSGGAFCTQCEAEGFRRITYYQDRPDVLAQVRPRVCFAYLPTV